MKLLSTTALMFFLIAATTFSLPLNSNISNSGAENLQVVNNEFESKVIADEILKDENTTGVKETFQLIAGKGRFKNPSISTGANNPDIVHPNYINERPSEYAGGHIIPEPLTIIMVGIGLIFLITRSIL